MEQLAHPVEKGVIASPADRQVCHNTANRQTSGKHNADSPALVATRCFAHDDLDVAPEAVEAVEHFGFADAAKLAAQHARQFGLRHAENVGGLLLGEVAVFDDFGNF